MHVQMMKSQVSFFDGEPIQNDILKTEKITYSPVTSVDSPNLEFFIPSSPDTYKNLNNTYIRLVVSIPNASTEQTAETGATVVNNIIGSLFKTLNVYFNNVLVNTSENTYAYRAYLEKLLNYGKEASETNLQASGWFLDTDDFDSQDENKNAGYKSRVKAITNNKKLEIYGKLAGDVFNLKKYLINGVDIRIQLNRNNPAFYMLGQDTHKSDIKIENAELILESCYVNPSLLMANEKLLEKHRVINYHMKRLVVRTFTLNSDVHTVSINNAIIGSLPSMLIFAMVKNDAFSGKRSLNPFNLQRFDLQNFQIVVNGRTFPVKPLEIKKDDNNAIYSRAYYSLFEAFNLDQSDISHQITMNNFMSGCFLLATDLSNDGSFGQPHSKNLEEGSVRIDLSFGAALPHTVTALLACEFDGMFNIDSQRVVTVGF